jgi:hypothetical protein
VSKTITKLKTRMSYTQYMYSVFLYVYICIYLYLVYLNTYKYVDEYKKGVM